MASARSFSSLDLTSIDPRFAARSAPIGETTSSGMSCSEERRELRWEAGATLDGGAGARIRSEEDESPVATDSNASTFSETRALGEIKGGFGPDCEDVAGDGGEMVDFELFGWRCSFEDEDAGDICSA